QPWGGGLLEILPGGTLAPNPSELLGSSVMAEVIRRLEAMSDMVIFDAPPLLPVTDAAVLGVNTDGAVLVVKSGATSRERLDRAVESLAGVSVHIVGAVLSMAPTKGPDSYHYYAYYGRDLPAVGIRGWLLSKRARRHFRRASAVKGRRLPPVETRPRTKRPEGSDVESRQR
ncbi:MAG: protein tyrosine kinase, partial [Actinomycetota bacterium]